LIEMMLNFESALEHRNGWFWYHRENAIYSPQEADREARVLHGVSVFQLSPRGRLLEIVRAERVEWKTIAAGAFWARPLEPSILGVQQNRPESSNFPSGIAMPPRKAIW
jgi:hypothetical protein